MSEYYRLEGKKAVPAKTYCAMGKEKIVARTDLPNGWLVSTVFLSLNHAFNDGPPMIFETMVFQNGSDVDVDRCSTWEQAEAMHARMVAKWSSPEAGKE